jgi:hypothetical protein
VLVHMPTVQRLLVERARGGSEADNGGAHTATRRLGGDHA